MQIKMLFQNEKYVTESELKGTTFWRIDRLNDLLRTHTKHSSWIEHHREIFKGPNISFKAQKKTIVYLTYLRVLLDDVSRDVGRQDTYKFSKLTSSTVNDSDFLERQGNKKVCYFPLKRRIKENNAT